MPKRNQRKLNSYDLSGDFGIGKDSKDREFYFDLEDYDLIKEFTWCVSGHSVETKLYLNTSLTMHKLVMNYFGDLVIDHKNSLIYDNRKSNLRVATKIQNGQNRKKAKGWRFEKKKKRYSARIVVNKKEIHLGYFDNEQLARSAYVEARKEYFGEFAPMEN